MAGEPPPAIGLVGSEVEDVFVRADDRALAVDQHRLRVGEKDVVAAGVQRGHARLQHRGGQKVVICGPLEQFAARARHRHVVVARGTDVGLVSGRNGLVTVAVIPADIPGRVRRRVVGDDQLEIVELLLEDRLECLREVPLPLNTGMPMVTRGIVRRGLVMVRLASHDHDGGGNAKVGQLAGDLRVVCGVGDDDFRYTGSDQRRRFDDLVSGSGEVTAPLAGVEVDDGGVRLAIHGVEERHALRSGAPHGRAFSTRRPVSDRGPPSVDQPLAAGGEVVKQREMVRGLRQAFVGGAGADLDQELVGERTPVGDDLNPALRIRVIRQGVSGGIEAWG